MIGRAGVRRVVDVRLNNVSQLAGFTKKDDLAYFLDRVLGVTYQHVPLLAPTHALLDIYKKQGGDWGTYEHEFIELMKKRRIEVTWAPELREADCLLCGEHHPEHCHRRLVAEYLTSHDGDIKVHHLF